MSYASQIRTFNRFYTNFLGLLNNHILDSPLSLSESRILYELGQQEKLPASELVSRLHVDKGYLSRILKKFEKQGYIHKSVSPQDGRMQDIRLSTSGRSLFDHINKQSEKQITSLTSHLDSAKKKSLARMLKNAEDMLTNCDNGKVSLKEIAIRTNLLPGDIGFIIKDQCQLYINEFNYGSNFEYYVAKGAVEFYQLYNPERNRVWICDHRGERIGCLCLMDRGAAAQLRFLFIKKPYRGIGLGKLLIKHYIDFLSQAGFESSFLWTTNEQEATSALYKHFGFELVEEKPSCQFGKKVIEQKYVLNL